MDSQQERIRARYLKQQREIHGYKKFRWFGASLGVLVLTIYGYSMYAIKQETILGEIDAEASKNP